MAEEDKTYSQKRRGIHAEQFQTFPKAMRTTHKRTPKIRNGGLKEDEAVNSKKGKKALKKEKMTKGVLAQQDWSEIHFQSPTEEKETVGPLISVGESDKDEMYVWLYLLTTVADLQKYETRLSFKNDKALPSLLEIVGLPYFCD